MSHYSNTRFALIPLGWGIHPRISFSAFSFLLFLSWLYNFGYLIRASGAIDISDYLRFTVVALLKS